MLLFFKQKTEYERRISDWISDVCSSDLLHNNEMVLGQLQTLLRLDGDTMERINRDLKAASGFQPVAVKEDMTEAEYSTILVRLPELPGIAPQRGFARNYPTGEIGRASWRERVCQDV